MADVSSFPHIRWRNHYQNRNLEGLPMHSNSRHHGSRSSEHWCRFRIHVESSINRFHDLYKKHGRAQAAKHFSEETIDDLETIHQGDRAAAAFQLLEEAYLACDIPPNRLALDDLLEWWRCLRSHSGREPSIGELSYEQIWDRQRAAKKSASEAWDSCVRFIEEPATWLDDYIQNMKNKQREIQMGLEIQALNAYDRDHLLRRMESGNQRITFRPKKQDNLSHQQDSILDGHEQFNDADADVEEPDNLGFYDARERRRKRLDAAFKIFRPDVIIRGSTSEDNQTVEAVIDSGNDGHNLITYEFLCQLKLESTMIYFGDGHVPVLLDANGKKFSPIGRIPQLSFKFIAFPNATWHWDEFHVAQEGGYYILLGRSFLLQDKPYGELVAPLVLNKKQKNKKSGETDALLPRQQAMIQKSAEKRELIKKKKEAEQPSQSRASIPRSWNVLTMSIPPQSWADDGSDLASIDVPNPEPVKTSSSNDGASKPQESIEAAFRDESTGKQSAVGLTKSISLQSSTARAEAVTTALQSQLLPPSLSTWESTSLGVSQVSSTELILKDKTTPPGTSPTIPGSRNWGKRSSYLENRTSLNVLEPEGWHTSLSKKGKRAEKKRQARLAGGGRGELESESWRRQGG